MLKAFYVSDEELWAAESADAAAADYEKETGEKCGDGYPRELTVPELNAEQPEFDEDENETGGKTSVQQMLIEASGTGFLAATRW